MYVEWHSAQRKVWRGREVRKCSRAPNIGRGSSQKATLMQFLPLLLSDILSYIGKR